MTGQLEIAERISSISVSSTMKVAADAEKLRSQGVDVVDFGAGDTSVGAFYIGDSLERAGEISDLSIVNCALFAE